MAEQFTLGEATIQIRLERLDTALAGAQRDVQQALSGGAFLRGMSSFSQATGEAGEETGGLLDNVSQLATTASFGFGSASKAAGLFSSQLSRLKPLLSGAIHPLVVGLTILGSGIAISAREAAKLDHSLETLRVGFNLTDVEVENLKSTLLAVNPLLGETTQFAKALTLAVGKGFVPTDGGAETVKFLEDTARFGRAIGQDPVRAMETLTEVLGAYGLQAGDAERVTRGLFQVGLRVGLENLPGIISGLERLAPAAREAGLKIEDVGAAMVEVAQSGLGAFRGTFALRQVIGSLTSQSEEFKKRFGIDLKKTIGEEGLVAAFRLLETAIKDDATAQKALGIGFTEFNTIMTILKNNAEGYKKSLQDLKNPTADLASLTPTLGESFGALTRSVKILLASVGAPLAAAMKTAAASVASLALSLTKFFARQPTKLEDSFSDATKAAIKFREQLEAVDAQNKEAAAAQTKDQERIIDIKGQEQKAALDTAQKISGANIQAAALAVLQAKLAFQKTGFLLSNTELVIKHLFTRLPKEAQDAFIEVVKTTEAFASARIALEQQVFNLRMTLGQRTVRDELATIETKLRAATKATEQTIADEQRRAQIIQSLRQKEESVGERIARKAADRLKKQGREFITESDLVLEAGEVVREETSSFFRPEDIGERIELKRLVKDVDEVTRVFGGTAGSTVRAFFETFNFGAPQIRAVREELLRIPEIKLPQLEPIPFVEKALGTPVQVETAVTNIETAFTRIVAGYNRAAGTIQGPMGPVALGAAGVVAIEELIARGTELALRRLQGLPTFQSGLEIGV